MNQTAEQFHAVLWLRGHILELDCLCLVRRLGIAFDPSARDDPVKAVGDWLRAQERPCMVVVEGIHACPGGWRMLRDLLPRPGSLLVASTRSPLSAELQAGLPVVRCMPGVVPLAVATRFLGASGHGPSPERELAALLQRPGQAAALYCARAYLMRRAEGAERNAACVYITQMIKALGPDALPPGAPREGPTPTESDKPLLAVASCALAVVYLEGFQAGLEYSFCIFAVGHMYTQLADNIRLPAGGAADSADGETILSLLLRGFLRYSCGRLCTDPAWQEVIREQDAPRDARARSSDRIALNESVSTPEALRARAAILLNMPRSLAAVLPCAARLRAMRRTVEALLAAGCKTMVICCALSLPLCLSEPPSLQHWPVVPLL